MVGWMDGSVSDWVSGWVRAYFPNHSANLKWYPGTSLVWGLPDSISSTFLAKIHPGLFLSGPLTLCAVHLKVRIHFGFYFSTLSLSTYANFTPESCYYISARNYNVFLVIDPSNVFHAKHRSAHLLNETKEPFPQIYSMVLHLLIAKHRCFGTSRWGSSAQVNPSNPYNFQACFCGNDNRSGSVEGPRILAAGWFLMDNWE